MTTRDLLLASWRAAILRVDPRGALWSTPATFAGQYLELAGGDPQRAIGMLPKVDGLPMPAADFLDYVRRYLKAVHDEELAERGPKLKVGT